MKKLFLKYLLPVCIFLGMMLPLHAQPAADSTAQSIDSTLVLDSDSLGIDDDELAEQPGVYHLLKTKFIEGNAGFMSLVALALIIGLAFCIERIIFLTLSQTDTERFMHDLRQYIDQEDYENAMELCRTTQGPVAAICEQALAHRDDESQKLESVVSTAGNLQIAKLEKGCSWISLCITMAPSLGFLGTVIGMVMAFDRIEQVGDISPTIVAGGMKVALITTIFGIIVALTLQLFYNFILTRIDRIVEDMEHASLALIDMFKHTGSK